ncbi:hypothetical protein NIM87_08900 [Devosia sp. XJ19-1]|uniref:Uncharacterized protein n=1 Tax=Devosia ureilytica TaxID=2952754 RepID=A0A9Q4APA0_9HYPH|nr:hypothetical protein [Devosia ureilytica]MCP8883614.1 hypothetical protein [Devosia ureilytica]MCP8887222.1 hypothetical protein [Devosia ureilytica]
MSQTIRTSLRGLCFLAGFALTTASMAAPIGDVSPSQDCFSKAALQHTLDNAKCGALPLEIRTPCIVQAMQTYVAATAACSNQGSGQKSTTLKQNIDAPFLRRIRN